MLPLQPHPASSDEFATFDPHLARAVVTVLRANGVHAWVGEQERGPGDVVGVHVRAESHEHATATLAAHMEEIQRLAAETRVRQGVGAGEVAEDDLESGPPLVMERFRSAGVLIALVLAPLLVITLARTPVSRGVALVVVILGAVLLAALRNRSSGDRDA